MQIKQRFELKRLLAPQMQQSLKILTLSLPDLKDLVEQELESNPTIEEIQPKETIIVKVGALDQDAPEPTPSSFSITEEPDNYYYGDSKYLGKRETASADLSATLISKKMSLQEVLLRQLGMFVSCDEEFKIGQEIIGNIDENGYLKVSTEEIAQTLSLPVQKIDSILGLIQQFEPNGVAARTIPECLTIQLKLANEEDPLVMEIVENHLEDVAKNRFKAIAKALNKPLEAIEPLIQKITKLDPKPGRNYSQDASQPVIPDIIIDQDGEDLSISINNEYMPTLRINRTYRNMLRDKKIDQKTRDFITQKITNAMELVRALSRRQSTLRRIIQTIIDIQEDAIKGDLSLLKPLTFHEVAGRLGVHETTVCRAIMNKYAKIPCGTVAMKDFFPSSINSHDGKLVSSTHVKKLIKTKISHEDKKHPISDQDICNMLAKENNLRLSRRTVAKYREDLKILSTSFRKER